MGCIRAPKATVRLSEIVGEQTAQMQSSHEGFVKLYYAMLRVDVDQFLKKVWISSFLAKAAVNKQFRKDLDSAYAISRLDTNVVEIRLRAGAALPPDIEAALLKGIANAIEQERAKVGQVLIGFGEGALKQIGLQREEMMSPIDEQERIVLEELRDGYADLQRAQAAIKGYLASAVKVEEERSAVLQKLGLLGSQKKILGAALAAGDAAAKALAIAKDGEKGVQDFLKKLQEGKDKIEALRNSGQPK